MQDTTMTPTEQVDSTGDAMRRSTAFSPAALREIRREQGWSREELADAAGLSVTTIATWERGQARPSVANLHGVAKALQVAVADLMPPTAPKSLAMLRAGKGLSQEKAAEQVGVSAATLRRAEAGVGELSPRTLAALATFFEMDEDRVRAIWQTERDARLRRLRRSSSSG